jgi:hypothetical protein
LNLADYILRDFHLGDRVRIMSLGKIKQRSFERSGNFAFYADPNGPVFSRMMLPFCEREFVIHEIQIGDGVRIVGGHDFGWTITTEMIEKV